MVMDGDRVYSTTGRLMAEWKNGKIYIAAFYFRLKDKMKDMLSVSCNHFMIV